MIQNDDLSRAFLNNDVSAIFRTELNCIYLFVVEFTEDTILFVYLSNDIIVIYGRYMLSQQFSGLNCIYLFAVLFTEDTIVFVY